MTRKLSHTKVAQHAHKIFADVGYRRVNLIEAGTGSGKSLLSPTRVWEELRGTVLVLVPSVDVAADNARRIAELSDYGWKLGKEVGIHTGRNKTPGTCIVFATYGSFIASDALQNRNWSAILLDESHVEQWQVEVARADVHDRLENRDNLFVMELSATMDADKLKSFWETAGVPVYHHRIDGEGTSFDRQLINRSVGTSKEDLSSAILDETADRFIAGDRFVMVVQPGMQDVEDMARKIFERVGSLPNVTVYTYHGETETDDVPNIISSLKGDERRIVVTTPRLLTGFNHQDLDSIVTCGRAKYPESDARGSSMLRLGEMSQAELTQALGRVGRFKDGQLILCSRLSFEERALVMQPEVERLSSLPLALGLVAMGRNPLSIRFCNQPRDLRGSMRRLKDWGFIDYALDITEEGIEANKLDIRPDLARFLLSVKNNQENTVEAIAAAVIVTAVSQSGNISLRNPLKDGRPVSVPKLNFTSDLYNEALRFLQVVQWDKKQVKEASWVSLRSLRRAKAIVYSLVKNLDDNRVWEFFGGIFEDDEVVEVLEHGKTRTTKVSPREAAWKEVGSKLSRQFGKIQRQLNIALIIAMRDNLYRAVGTYRGVSGLSSQNQTTSVGGESVVAIGNSLFLANSIVITPRNGNNPFPILTDVTKITPEELVSADPEMFSIEEVGRLDSYRNAEGSEMRLYINGISFHRYERSVSSVAA